METLETTKIIALVCWIILAISIICLVTSLHNLKKEIEYQKQVKKIYKHKLEIAESQRDLYKNKYLDVVSKIQNFKTTANYKHQIINDYKNHITCVEMGRKYGLRPDTIRKALYRWGIKKGVK